MAEQSGLLSTEEGIPGDHLEDIEADVTQPLRSGGDYAAAELRARGYQGGNPAGGGLIKGVLVGVSVLSAVLVVAVIILAVTLIQKEGEVERLEQAEQKLSPAEWDELKHRVQSAMDTSVNPCNDFYQFACGGWIRDNPIPADQTSWGRGFGVIALENRKRMREILESSTGKIGDYYQACMDTAGRDKVGATPLKSTLAKITALSKLPDLFLLAAQLRRDGVGGWLSDDVGPDAFNPNLNILNLGQGGLALPNRDYYLKDQHAEKRAQYKIHIAKMLTLAGVANTTAYQDAEMAFNIELELAKVHLPQAELRDPHKTYNKFTVPALKNISSGFDWDLFFKGAYPSLSLNGTFYVSVETPAYFTSLGSVVKSVNITSAKAYLKWHYVHSVGSVLSSPFVNETFRFYGTVMTGQKQQSPQWKKCVGGTDGALGMMLGKAYVDQYFGSDSQREASKLVTGIEKAFHSTLDTIDWMDDVTRKRAIEKLGMITNKVGRPSKWIDYSTMTVSKSNHFTNVLNARHFEYNRDVAKVMQPVDKEEWDMTPPTVNAYYDPPANQMVFPAGIIQENFFNVSWPIALNHGGMGAVMGHELTHAFDDQGSQYNGQGALQNWWSDKVLAEFKKRTQCVVDLYSGYKVDGEHVNGTLTLGENIADMGGVKDAYRAYKTQADLYTEGPQLLDNYNNDQLFFIAYAQTWCSSRRKDFAKMLLVTDPHSPPHYRVIGPLSNFDKFGETFSCSVGSPMNPQDKCDVW